MTKRAAVFLGGLGSVSISSSFLFASFARPAPGQRGRGRLEDDGGSRRSAVPSLGDLSRLSGLCEGRPSTIHTPHAARFLHLVIRHVSVFIPHQTPYKLDDFPTVKNQVTELFQRTFGHAPHVVTRAPGRIEFIGNHTDYNGGPVLGASIDRTVWVAARAVPGAQRARLMSPLRVGIVEADLAQPERRTGPQSWVNYPLGVFLRLRARGAAPTEGFEFAASSDLPSGSGLSSSAALELATGYALAALAGKTLPPKELALLSQEAENQFVGVPCGILDQGVSAFGRRNHLVYIDCAALEFRATAMPEGTRFWIFNTHKKHSLVDSMYAQRHAECREAFAAVQAANPGVGCLAAASLGQLDAVRSKLRPEVYKRARHVIEETARVHDVVAALGAGDLTRVGKALVASHRSSQFLFENSVPELDTLVDILEPHPRVLGARLTGGGFGGAVMALTTSEFSEADAASVASAYEARFGAKPDILRCETSDGAGLEK